MHIYIYIYPGHRTTYVLGGARLLSAHGVGLITIEGIGELTQDYVIVLLYT